VPPEVKAKSIGFQEFPLWIQSCPAYGNVPQHNHYLLREAILTGKPYPVKALKIQGHNALTNQHNPARVAEALQNLEFLLVIDFVMTPTARYADIVLPAATVYEQNDEFEVVGNYLFPKNKVVEPLGESRSEWQVLFDLAVKMGMGEAFSNGDMDADLTKMLEPSGITMADLRQHPEGIPFEAPEMVYEKYEKVFAAFPDQKAQLYSKLFEEKGFNPLPEYVGPPESLDKTPDLVKDYPLIMYDPHSDEISHHSWLRHLPWLRELAKYPWVKINPETAKKYGIEEGDWVKIESPHGWCRAVAWLFPGMRPDTIQGKHGWWQGCDELGLPEYGVFDGGVSTSVLYEDPLIAHDPVSATWWKHTLVRISKTTPPEGVPSATVKS